MAGLQVQQVLQAVSSVQQARLALLVAAAPAAHVSPKSSVPGWPFLLAEHCGQAVYVVTILIPGRHGALGTARTAGPVGKYSVTVGGVSLFNCTGCPIGRYGATAGTAECPACPSVAYSNVTGALTCKACPVGTVSPTSGAVSAQNCTSCAPGRYNANATEALVSGRCVSMEVSRWTISIGLDYDPQQHVRRTYHFLVHHSDVTAVCRVVLRVRQGSSLP